MNISGTSRGDEIIKIDCSKVTHCRDIVLDKIEITTMNGNDPIVECANVIRKYSNTTEIDGCLKMKYSKTFVN